MYVLQYPLHNTLFSVNLTDLPLKLIQSLIRYFCTILLNQNIK